MAPRFIRLSTSGIVTLVIIGLISWSTWQRWQLLAVSPFPIGVDGYFYPIQLRALLSHGSLNDSSSPLAFYLLAPFAAATDPITGAKLGAALFGALLAWPAYGVGTRLGGSRSAGLLTAALATTSLGSLYLTVEFVKNSIGLTVGLAALWAVLVAIDAPSRKRIALALAAIVAAYATHKMAAALVVLVALPAILAALTRRGALRGRRLLYVLGALCVLAIATTLLGAIAPQRFLSPRDLALLDGLWTTDAAWTAPALVTTGGALAIGHDALLGGALALLALVTAALRARLASPVDATHTRIPAAGWPIILLALAIGLPWLAVTDRQGLGFRLRLAAFVPMALTAAIVARGVFAHWAARKDPVLASLAIVLAIARAASVPSVLPGEVITHPALVSAAQALVGRVPAGSTLIIPERHLAFLVAWYTGASVALRPEHIPPAHRYRLLPMSFIGEDSPLDRALLSARTQPNLPPPLGLHPDLINGLVLVAEPTWQWALAQLPPADRARYTAWPTI